MNLLQNEVKTNRASLLQQHHNMSSDNMNNTKPIKTFKKKPGENSGDQKRKNKRTKDALQNTTYKSKDC